MPDILPLFILGSSGHAREIAHYAQAASPQRRVLYVDNHATGDDCVGIEQYYMLLERDGGESIMGAGRCETRQRIALEIRPPFATLIHPSAVVMGTVGAGCVVAPGAVIAPGADVASHVMVNYNATVGHDAHIDTLSVIGPGSAIGGWCHLHEAVYVGAGALIRERLVVGRNSIVGMGAVVTKDVPADTVVVGIPAAIRQTAKGSGGWL